MIYSIYIPSVIVGFILSGIIGCFCGKKIVKYYYDRQITMIYATFYIGHKNPLSKEIIDTFTVMHGENGDNCAICLCDYTEEKDCMRIKCNHMFHSRCITDWFNRSPTCPICRYDLSILDV